MQSVLTDALAAFITRYPDALHAHQRITGWLLDHAPTQRRAVRGLAAVARLELPEILAAKERIDAFEFRRWVKRLTSEEALPVDLAEASLLAWAGVLKVEAPSASALQGPLDTGLLTGSLDCLAVLHLALESARVPPVAQVRLESSTDTALRDLRVEVSLAGTEVGSRLRSTTWTGRIDLLRGRQTAILDDVNASVGPHVLSTINAPTPARWWLEVRRGDEVLLRTFEDVTVLPPSSWLGARGPRLAAAAFVLPDDPVVGEIVLHAAENSDAEDPRPVAERALDALLGAFATFEVATVERHGDGVVGPKRVFANGGSVREVALLLAACLEQAGLETLIMESTHGPAVGVWGSQGRPALTETDDPELLKRALRGGLLTLVSASTLERVGESWLEEDDDTTTWAVDLTGARELGVSPLPGSVLDEPLDPLPAGELGDARQRLIDRSGLADHARRRRGAFASSLNRVMASEDVPPRVSGWKNRLLDLTLRNPLLNFRARSSTIPLVMDDLAGLEDVLSTGRAITLMARPPAPRPGQPVPPVDSFMQDTAFANGRVYADLTEARLPKSAKAAWRAARTLMDEGGIQAMFLVVGMLRFYESNKPDVERTAPLLLVPVEMKRKGTGPWRFRKADREPEFNVALLEYLQREFGIAVPGIVPLPMDSAGVDVDAVLSRVDKAIGESHVASTWSVDRSATIGILAFTRVRMWRDLESRSRDLMRHPLVRRLALVDEELPEQLPLPTPQGLDERWPAAEIFCPMLVDGSQLSAVAAAHEGHSFVLEGPPGTGKSQTITNIISHSLAHGRSVLFVSQKRAALEVVHDRLARVGLGPLCLELHSSKARKTEFIAQLREAAEFRARRPKRDWESRAGALQKLVAELGALPRALHAEHPPGKTVADAVLERWERGVGDPLPCDFDPARAVHADWFDDARDALVAVVDARARLRVDTAPLEPIRATEWPVPIRDEAARELDVLLAATEDLVDATWRLQPWLGDLTELSSDDLDLLGVVLDKVHASPGPRRALLDGHEEVVDAWRREVQIAAVLRNNLAENYKPSLLSMDYEGDRLRLATWMSIPILGWLMLWGVRARARLVSLAKRTHAELFEDYEAAEVVSTRSGKLLTATVELHPVVGHVDRDAWGLPIVPDLDPLLAYSRELRDRASRFPRALDLASDAPPAGSREAVAGWREAFATWQTARNEVRTRFKLSAKAFGGSTSRAHLRQVVEDCQTWKGLVGELRDWGTYRRARTAAAELGVKKAVRAFEKGEVDGADMTARFEDAWRAWWLRHHLVADPALSGFDGTAHRDRERRFDHLDEEVRGLCQEVVVARVAARQPQLDQGAPPNSAAGILLRQFKRKSGLATPRRLFSECAGLIRQLKPCVLMSPLSAAQYIDPSQPPFDLVIFDEASQVPLHEAIGAIARGRQVIVVGDSKQLPPTAFFAGGGASNEEEDDSLVAELESILDECVASGLPTLRLSWHYRSRHHALIAFSNARYYDDELQVLPAAQAHVPRMGLSYVKVDGVYDRGGTSTNRIEAEAVVADVLGRLKDPAERHRSLCIVTFSRAQQSLVEDLLEEERLKDPSLEPFFDAEAHEPLMVKNLENVQGDERDVVLFSIGYGPDKNGKMTANLGPLGQAGGERRLNVAITRAREQLVVYGSFHPDQLDLRRTSARGLHDMKAFLEDASSRGTALVGRTHHESDAASDAIVSRLQQVLTEAGHVVDTDVGEGSWRLDLAVRSADDPDIYVLGLEVDGPRYAATPTVRDRDRLRWSLLRGLGWRGLHRVRILEWLEDSDRVIADVLDAAKAAQEAPAPEPPVVAPEPEDAWEEPEETGEVVVAGDADFGEESVEVTPYTIYVANLGIKEDFRRNLRTNDGFLRSLAELEGPVSRRVAERRLAAAWGFTRSTSRIVDAIDRCLARATPAEGPFEQDGFLWPLGRDASWRGYRVAVDHDDSSRRDVEDIALEELANAMQHQVQRYGLMPRVELMRSTAKLLGIGSLRAKTKARLVLAMDVVESRGEVTLGS